MLHLIRRTPTPASKRRIEVEDGLAWLATTPDSGAIVTSIAPDATEEWLATALSAMLVVGHPVVLHVTDRLEGDELVSVAERAMHLARHLADKPVAWHAVVRNPHFPGFLSSNNPGKFGFSHILGFGKGMRPRLGEVLEDGTRLHPAGPGLIAARAMVEWAAQGNVRICDPFCVSGVIPAVADALGIEATGICATEAQADAARRLVLTRKQRKTPHPRGRG